MLYKIKQNIINNLAIFFLLFSFIFLNYLVFFGNNSVIAASTGISIATLIGGTTGGVSDVCCNGIVLSFDSIDSSNRSILDGDALWETGSTNSYNYHNEFTEGYYTLGLLSQGQCITIESECESAENIPVIKHVGTNGIPTINITGGGI